MKQLKIAFCVGISFFLIGMTMLVHARRQAVNFMMPLKDLVVYKSCVVSPLGTDSKGASFVFRFLPKGEDSHYAVFYVETSVWGKIKSFSGPFVNDRVVDPIEVRPCLLAEQEKKQADLRFGNDGTRSSTTNIPLNR